MKNLIEKFVEGLESKPGAKEDQIFKAEKELALNLPDQYKRFLLYRNGVEGLLPNSFYISLWQIEGLKPFNKLYNIEEFAPGLLLFGSDGRGTVYAFDTRDPEMPIVSIPFIPLDLNEIEFLCHTFNEFMERILSWRVD